MATNKSLKEQIKSRKAAAEGFLSIPVDQVKGVQAVAKAEDKSSASSIEMTSNESPVCRLGFKAYLQLALRTGQYRAINVIEVYEGELKLWNPVTEELLIDAEGRKNDTIAGYAGYFELLNGFKKCVFWSRKKLENLKKKGEKNDLDFKKIVVKDLLTKWGILSHHMQSASAAELNEEVLLYKPLLKEEDIYSLETSYQTYLEI